MFEHPSLLIFTSVLALTQNRMFKSKMKSDSRGLIDFRSLDYKCSGEVADSVLHTSKVKFVIFCLCLNLC